MTDFARLRPDTITPVTAPRCMPHQPGGVPPDSLYLVDEPGMPIGFARLPLCGGPRQPLYFLNNEEAERFAWSIIRRCLVSDGRLQHASVSASEVGNALWGSSEILGATPPSSTPSPPAPDSPPDPSESVTPEERSALLNDPPSPADLRRAGRDIEDTFGDDPWRPL